MRCERIAVSTADARYALVARARPLTDDCRRSLGDGYTLLSRSRATSLRWRIIFRGSDPPPCTVPRTVRIDLLSGDCLDP